MSSRPTTRGDQCNRSTAILGASRSLASNIRLVSSSEPMTDLTSQIATALSRSWAAKMSIDPRSPNSEKDTSAVVSHPRARKTRTARSTSAAWRSSRSRSAAAPCHHSESRARPSTASMARRMRDKRTSAARPASMCQMSSRGMPAAAASCAWVMPIRLRRSGRSWARRSSSGCTARHCGGDHLSGR